MATKEFEQESQLPNDDFEEIRLALVMTGGSSLAVWMGGVTHEINRLLRGDSAYGDILRLTQATARVDVISGTSAGGLNGAFLGMAVSRGAGSLEALRRLWVTQGSFEKLLRDPFEADPPSLLKGDDFFLPRLRSALRELADESAPVDANSRPIDLMMTGTLLTGRDSAAPDDFGSLVVDSDHAALFRFRRGGGSGHIPACGHHADDARPDDFVGDTAVDRLALAARSSASFPIAFEPSFVPIGNDDSGPDRPNMRCNANFRRSKYVVDGGVLMNKPLEPALRSIFEMPAARQVRRVLAYVVPDPGERVVEQPDRPGEGPTVLKVGLDSLVTLPRSESVSAQLHSLKRHNDKAGLQRKTRFETVLALQPREGKEKIALETVADRLFPAYLEARVKLSVTRILSAIADGINDLEPRGQAAPLWNLEPLREALESARTEFLPRRFPTIDEVPGATWEWGVQSIEDVGRVVLDLLRRPLRMVAPTGGPKEVRRRLRKRRQDVHIHLDWVRRVQEKAIGDYWSGKAAGAIEAMRTGKVKDWAEEALEEWPGKKRKEDGAETHPRVRAELGQRAMEIAAALTEAKNDIKCLAGDAEVLRFESPNAAQLRDVVDALVPSSSVETCLLKLLSLHVIETVFAPGTQELDQVVELIQISGNTPNGFDTRSDANEKIAGIRLGHFGAFYKTSWRANDWMWGRLDGAYRLAQVILEPARLRQLELSREQVVKQLEPVVLGEKDGAREALGDGSGRGWNRDAALAELSFLRADDPAGAPSEPSPTLPMSLPVCTRALARRLQLEILQEELPHVAVAIRIDEKGRAYESPETLAFATGVEEAQSGGGGSLRAKAARDLFPECRIGQERIRDEAGSDLFAATLTKAASIASSIGQGTKLGFSALRGAFRFVRGIVLTIYMLSLNAVKGGTFGFGVTIAVLALGAILVSAEALDGEGGSGAALALGLVLLAAGLGWAALRAKAGQVLVAIVVMTALLSAPESLLWINSTLTESGSLSDESFLGKTTRLVTDHRLAFVMIVLFAGPLLLGITGRAAPLAKFVGQGRRGAAWVGLLLTGTGGLTWSAYQFHVFGAVTPDVHELVFAGSATSAARVRAGWSPAELQRVESATGWEFMVIVAGVVALTYATALASEQWKAAQRRRCARAGVWIGRAVALAGLFAATANLLLFRLLGNPVDGDALPRWLGALSVGTIAIVGVAILYGVVGGLAALLRGRAKRPGASSATATDA